MLSFASIFIIFASIAVSSFGMLALYSFYKRTKQFPQRKIIYWFIFAGFVTGVTQGLSSFFSPVLYILGFQNLGEWLWLQVMWTTPIFLWIHWVTVFYWFSGRKLWGAKQAVLAFVYGAFLFYFLPEHFNLALVNGVVQPINLSIGIKIFGAMNIVSQIGLFLYSIYHTRRLKKVNQVYGWARMISLAFFIDIFTYTSFSLGVLNQWQAPALFIFSWIFAALFVSTYFLGNIAIDENDRLTLERPTHYIASRLWLKMSLSLAPLLWVPILISVLWISSILGNNLGQVSFDIASAQAYVLLVSFVVLVVATIIIIKVIRLFVSPVDNLSRATKRIARGDLELTVPVFSGDEIGKLSEDFNKMAYALKQKSTQVVELTELDKLKTEFISLASHQLRTPLTEIRWALQFMAGKISEAERADMLGKAQSAVKRLVNLVGDLLNVSRIEKQETVFKKVDINLAKVIKKAVKLNENEINKKNLKVNVEFDPEQFPEIKGDAKRIQIAFQNIIDNAVKYTEEGGVQIKCSQDNDKISCFVKDTGIGIPKQYHKGIFSKFFRASNVVTVDTEGTGLGLYLSKNIIDQHQGKISFTSEEGEGTTVFVELPVGE